MNTNHKHLHPAVFNLLTPVKFAKLTTYSFHELV